MKGPELFDLWAPPDAVWSRWAKPVLFAQWPPPLLSRAAGPEAPASAEAAAPVPDLPLDLSLAVVVDLPGAVSVHTGLALARRGYRPVPSFNGSHFPGALVNVEPILRALADGAGSLGGLQLPPEAPPAFLLDSRRQSSDGAPEPGRYDNRWLAFPQDFPSANFLLSRRIHRVLLIQEAGRARPADDLAHVLRRWQEAGIEILLLHPGEGSPAALQVEKPSRFRSLSYRALAILGLRRNSAGGFGSIIPLPPSGGAG
jgi:hypothetical protein